MSRGKPTTHFPAYCHPQLCCIAAFVLFILPKRFPLPEGNEQRNVLCGQWMLKSKLWVVAEDGRLIRSLSLDLTPFHRKRSN